MEGKNSCKKKKKNTAKCLQRLCGVVELGITSFLPLCGFCVTTWGKKNILKYACVYCAGRQCSTKALGVLTVQMHCSRWPPRGVPRALCYVPHLRVKAPSYFSPRNSLCWLNCYLSSDTGWVTKPCKSLRTAGSCLLTAALLHSIQKYTPRVKKWGCFGRRVKTSRWWIKEHFPS